MELTHVNKLQDDARSLARAAVYLGRAANELAPMALPAAKDAVTRVPGVARGVCSRVSAALPEKVRERQALVLAVAGIGAAGFASAAIAHVVHHRKIVSAYRKQRRLEASEHQQEADVERQLSGASVHCTAAQFLDSFEDAQEGDGLKGPGCFAICAYDLEPEEGDYGAFRDVYVGASKDMATSVQKQLDGHGNLYVHADMVYKRPLMVFFFPCEGYEVYARKEGLVRTLGAEGSYNRISEISDLD